MTQHLSVSDTQEDTRTMRRLGLIVTGFIAFTAAMALGVGIVLG